MHNFAATIALSKRQFCTITVAGVKSSTPDHPANRGPRLTFAKIPLVAKAH